MCEARVAGRRGRSRLIRISGPLRAPHQLHVIRVILLCAVRRVASRRVSVPLRTSTQHVLSATDFNERSARRSPPPPRHPSLAQKHDTRGKCAASCRTDRLADGYAVYTTSFQCRALFRSVPAGAARRGDERSTASARHSARRGADRRADVCSCVRLLRRSLATKRNETKRNGTPRRQQQLSEYRLPAAAPLQVDSKSVLHTVQYFSVRI